MDFSHLLFRGDVRQSNSGSFLSPCPDNSRFRNLRIPFSAFFTQTEFNKGRIRLFSPIDKCIPIRYNSIAVQHTLIFRPHNNSSGGLPMNDKKILTVQDISCVGQCSLTVALPIISACGIETCVLPSAVLSTHTGGFTGYTFRDLTGDIPAIVNHWKKEGIVFDAVYSGYLGSKEQIALVKEIMQTMGTPDSISIADPAMADNGKLYPGFDDDFVEAMKELCSSADIILPNITEACLLTGTEYRTEYDEAYIRTLLSALSDSGAKTVVLTGVGYTADTTGVVTKEPGKEPVYYVHKRFPTGCHGTGDVFASAFAGALMRDRAVCDAARIAADFTLSCIENTLPDEKHRYGVKFEQMLPKLIRALNE